MNNEEGKNNLQINCYLVFNIMFNITLFIL